MEIPAVKRKIQWLLVLALVVFLGLQFTNPARTNPPVKNDFITAMAPPPDVANHFRAACYDCHSHQTRWPWYSRIAPMSWSIASDVEYGRGNLNLSEWPTNAVKVAKKLDIMSGDIRDGAMPMKKYTLIHHDARLTDDQRKQMADWLDAAAEKSASQNASH